MPVVQDKYTIDVTNRFGISEDVVEDSGDEIENVDPFALINEMEAKAEEAKKQPKKKVKKSKDFSPLVKIFPNHLNFRGVKIHLNLPLNLT